MSAEPSAVPGSPAPAAIQWLDRPGRFVQIGLLRTSLPPDHSIILAELMLNLGRCVTYDNLLNRLYMDQRREEPVKSLDSLKVKVCQLRKLGLKIRNVSAYNMVAGGYVLEGVECPLEGAGA